MLLVELESGTRIADLGTSIDVDGACKYKNNSNSPVAISITWKMVPHEILLWFPVH